METEFPKSQNNYLTAKDFQDNEVTLTFKGWNKKANEDRLKDGKVTKTWVDCLDYCLKYSYPEMAVDKAHRQILDDAGQPMKNRNFDPKYPQGYSIQYIFEEGTLESGSMPLFNAFSRLRPSVGERIVMMRTGELLETKWFLCRKADRDRKEVPEIQTEKQIGGRNFTAAELQADESTPF